MSNRPRPSVLDMFDPLARPSTPPRDGSSSDSDKENSQPVNSELGMTAIFGRTYKLQHCSPTQPRQLKNRLVDVGDMTLDLSQVHVEEYDSDDEDQHLLSISMPEDNEDASDSETENTEPPTGMRTLQSSPATPRTPLGELQVDLTTPVLRSKVFKRKILESSPSTPQTFSKSPLSAVIDSVNSSGRSFASQEPSTPTLGSPLPSPKLAPEIKVSSADSDADDGDEADTEENENDIPEPENVPLGPALLPSPGLLPSALDSSVSRNTNRMSLDLHSSFQLQFSSSDASFDLMNDKISFLHSTSKGGESFLNDLDESMEDDENVAPTTMPSPASSSKTTPRTSPNAKEVINALSPSLASLSVPADEDHKHIAEVVAADVKDTAEENSDSESKPTSLVEDTSVVRSAVFHPPVQGPVFTAPVPKLTARSSAQAVMATPKVPAGRRTSMAPPALVPALRIVKRRNEPEPRVARIRPSAMSMMKEEPAMVSTPVMLKEQTGTEAATKPRRSSVSTARGAANASGPRRLGGVDAVAPPVQTLKLGGSGPKRIKVPASAAPAEVAVRPASYVDAPAPIRSASRMEAPAPSRSLSRVSSAPVTTTKDATGRAPPPRAVSSRLPAPSSRIPGIGRATGLPMPATKRAAVPVRRA
ncbi:hypothetical protein BD626DRAFT_566578 [Schizophyllum amplum]|uniref:Uncharacterized protein n=1 Tax=Schizophyllum amplum TaxID=97359 RepID=A0A550CMA7_9AGAR|nr:hypothetical protein BD626DRAFT_566578 [Auriculariopsis ampla]